MAKKALNAMLARQTEREKAEPQPACTVALVSLVGRCKPGAKIARQLARCDYRIELPSVSAKSQCLTTVALTTTNGIRIRLFQLNASSHTLLNKVWQLRHDFAAMANRVKPDQHVVKRRRVFRCPNYDTPTFCMKLHSCAALNTCCCGNPFIKSNDEAVAPPLDAGIKFSNLGCHVGPINNGLAPGDSICHLNYRAHSRNFPAHT